MSSFNEEEERAFKILEHINYRDELNHLSQRIINMHFQLYLLKKSMDIKDIVSSSLFTELTYKLKLASRKKLEIIRNLQDNFCMDIDKFNELETRIHNNLRDISVNLSSMGQIRAKLKKQRIQQVKLLENIDNCLIITRDQ